MSPRNEESFTPPTPEQVRAHLDRNPPRGRSRTMSWLTTAVMAAALALTLLAPNGATLVLALLLLLLLFFLLNWRTFAFRRLEAATGQVQEAAVRRRWVEALRRAWRLLPSLAAAPELHGRAVAFIAHSLDQVQAHESAIVAYNYLIDHLPPEHPAGVQFRVQRAMAQLASDQLVDADETLRRLRGSVERYKETPISASYRLANLIQQARTNHYADAVATSPTLLDDLRPLGVDAGFGHALMALAYFQSPEPAESTEDQKTYREHAAEWWSRATLLLPIPLLVGRFAELEPLKDALAPSTASASPPPSTGNP